VIEDRAAELSEAMAVMDQWRRAEPNHRYLTKTQLDARLASVQRETRARHAAADRPAKRIGSATTPTVRRRVWRCWCASPD